MGADSNQAIYSFILMPKPTTVEHKAKDIWAASWENQQSAYAKTKTQNREADQRLYFRYLDSTIPLLPKYKISSL